MSNYPSNLDTDLELPRATNDVSEITAEYVNSIRDAVIAIQETIGVNPHGLKSDINERLSVSIDQNGYIKKAALNTLGLVSLPIVNSQVSTNAGIEESKLELDYGTYYLKSMIDSLKTDFDGIMQGFSSGAQSLSLHLLGLANQHDGYHIKINGGDFVGVAGLEAQTVGDALNEIATYLVSGSSTIESHIDGDLPTTVKHNANKIKVDTSSFEALDATATDVQSVIDSIDSNWKYFSEDHLDLLHSNGIFKEIRSGALYNPNYLLYGPIFGSSYAAGSSVITIAGISSFATYNICAGDILSITDDSLADYGTYQIAAVGPVTSAESLGNIPQLSADQLLVFHVFSETKIASDLVSISIYKSAYVSSELSPLCCSVRNNETIVDSINVLSPITARVKSTGFNGSIINGSGFDVIIKVGVGSGIYRQLTIEDLNLQRLTANQANPVDANSVAERINAYVSDPTLANHFPITAFSCGNELVIAHNWAGANYTLEIVSGGSANYALGFDVYGSNVVGKTIVGNNSDNFVVNGVVLNDVRNVLSAIVEIGSSTDTFILKDSDGNTINPLAYGITTGSVMHVVGHTDTSYNGSYTLLSSNTTSVSTFVAEPIAASAYPETFSVFFTDANVTLNSLGGSETTKGIVEVVINKDGEVFYNQRLSYGDSIGTGIEIVDISSNFPSGSCSLYVNVSGSTIYFNIIDDTIYGDTVEIESSFRGMFNLYHPNGISYIKLDVVSSSISGGLESLFVSSSANEDEVLLLCNLHFDGVNTITSVVDKRLFGNVGNDQLRDDVVVSLFNKPNSELRSDGVVSGFDILNIAYYDSVASLPAVPLRGGVAYVNGKRVPVETQKVIVPVTDEEGNSISGRKLIAINEYGTVQVINDEIGETLIDGYEASSSLGKLLPLYYVDFSGGGVTNTVDVRNFINNIDNKIEIVVDQSSNNTCGSFKTLEGALLFASRYPGKERPIIKIINNVVSDVELEIPDGISIIGCSVYGGGKQKIISSGLVNKNFITLKGNNRLENIEITCPDSAQLRNALVYIDGSNCVVENCYIAFTDSISTSSGSNAIELTSNAEKNVTILNNRINNVYAGIVSEHGCENLVIKDNYIENVCGTGGLSYGIFVQTSARESNNVSILNNTVLVPSVVSSTDIRGIEVDIGYDLDNLSIIQNSIVHAAQNTVSNGIRVSTIDGYTGVSENVIISHNIIDGVKLDDNEVYGIYVANSTNTLIHNNLIKNVGVYYSGRENVCAIKIDDSDGTRLIDIANNIIRDCDLITGIDVGNQVQDSKVSINNNQIWNAGGNAYYIIGTTAHSSITNNLLIGPGLVGIRWTGYGSKIAGNSLDRPHTVTEDDDTVDFAFSSYGIYCAASELDVENNTINGMIYLNSVGISNAGSGRDRIKICNNTISGEKIYRAIALYGTGHTVVGNRIQNDEIPTGGSTTTAIYLSAVTDSSILNNHIGGTISYGIFSDSSVVSGLTIAGNIVVADPIEYSSIKLNGTTTTCFIIGNNIPDGVSENNAIGQAHSYLSYNTNVIGVNYGLRDSISIHASSASTSFEDDGILAYANIPHWVLTGGYNYWSVNQASSDDDRRLYFPISGIPNGAKLVSAQVQGNMVVEGGTSLDAQLFKRSVNETGFTETAISSLLDLSSVSGQFDNLTSDGTVDVTTSGYEIVNYKESNYYLKITYSGTSSAPANIKIYGITINFIY